MLGLGNGLTGGVVTAEAAWAPSDISSLIHWYKYDTGITLDSHSPQCVTLWEDQEGSNDLESDGVEDNSPIYDSGPIKFSAAGDALQWGTGLSLGTFSFYFRYETNDVSSDWMVKGGSTDWIKVQDSAEIRIKIGTRMDWDISGISTDTKVNLGVDRASNGDIGVFINGVAQSVQGGYTGNVATSTTFDIDKVGSPLVTIKMYEILVFNDVLSSGDKTSLNKYLDTI